MNRIVDTHYHITRLEMYEREGKTYLGITYSLVLEPDNLIQHEFETTFTSLNQFWTTTVVDFLRWG